MKSVFPFSLRKQKEPFSACRKYKWRRHKLQNSPLTSSEESVRPEKLYVMRLKATVAILENKLHALLLTAARCLKERPHKALLRLTTSTTSSFVCWRQKNNCTRDYALDWKSKTLYWIFRVVPSTKPGAQR